MKRYIIDLFKVILYVTISLFIIDTIRSCIDKPLQDDIKVKKEHYYGQKIRHNYGREIRHSNNSSSVHDNNMLCNNK